MEASEIVADFERADPEALTFMRLIEMATRI
jgi:hypothetical protein